MKEKNLAYYGIKFLFHDMLTRAYWAGYKDAMRGLK